MTRVADLARLVASIIGCYGTMRPDRTVVGHPSVTPASRSVDQILTGVCRVTSGDPALVLEPPAVHSGPTGRSPDDDHDRPIASRRATAIVEAEQVVGMDLDVFP